jgi:transposase
MDKTFRDWDVDQVWLFPPSIQELVPEGHLAHLVRETVRNTLDLSAILDEYREVRGCPPFHPAMMTALLLYGYCTGVFSSRRIARACEERIDFMAVTAMQKPDFRTISEFRRRHLTALSGLFVQVLGLCRRAGLVKLGHVALDGTKIKANASKHKAMSYGRMKEKEPLLAAKVAKWMADAKAADAEEDRTFGADRRGDEMPAWVSSKEKRAEKMRAAMAELEAEARAEAKEKAEKAGKSTRSKEVREAKPDDKSQRNFTDPESRIMKTSNGFVQAYNCQAAVDSKNQIIVAQSVTNEANDKRQLIPMLDEIKRNCGHQADEISADSGYCSESNLKEVSRRRINGYIATGRQKHREGCAPNAKRGPHVAAMARKLRRAGHRSRYRLRKILPEPVFGQIKQARGFRQFLMRGLEKVAGEWALIATAHNFLKYAATVA